MHVSSAVKLAVASFYGYGLSWKTNPGAVLDALRRDGLYIAPDPLPTETFERLRAACDEIYSGHPEAVALESNGSDLRIYGIDQLSRKPVFTEMQDDILAEARAFYGSDRIEHFVMAGDISWRSDGLGSGSGWHRDSAFRHQFKAIIYLTDASVDEGPFEFVKGSHKAPSAVRSARHLDKPLAQDRFTDEEVRTLVGAGIIDAPSTCVGKAGTMIFADTRGLHRGRPLASGRRRAVTFYVYHKSVPANIVQVLAAGKSR